MGYPLVNTTVFSTGNLQHSHQALLTTQAGTTISFIPTSAVDEINAINIIELSLLKDSRHGKRSITSQPLPREALCGLADNNKLISSNANIKQEPICKMCSSTLCRCSTAMDNISDHNLLNIKTKYEENMLISLPTSPLSEVDVKSNKIYSSRMPVATSNALSLCSSRDSMPSCSSSNRSLNTSSCVVKESVASDCSTRRSATGT